MNQDGCVRCLAGLSDNHHILVLPRDGNLLALWNGSAWETTVIPTLNVDVWDVTIDGVAHQVINPDTDYRIYLYLDSGGNVALEISTTQEHADAPTAYQTKFGDITRRLIGGCHYFSVGGTFSGGHLVFGSGELGFGAGAQNNNVGSYFNSLSLNPSITVGGGSDNTGIWTRVTTDMNRLTLWLWGDAREPLVIAQGTFSNSSLGVPVYAGIGYDGNPPSSNGRWAIYTPNTANQAAPFCVVLPCNANGEGMHTFDLWIRSEFSGHTGYINSQATLACKYLG